MQWKHRSVGSVDVLELSGKVVIGEGELALRRELRRLIDGGSRKILLSLERVGFMDTAGLGELVGCFKRANEAGGTIKLLRPSGQVAELLSVTQTDALFEILHDEAEAIDSF